MGSSKITFPVMHSMTDSTSSTTDSEHLRWMDSALEMAEEAFNAHEVPVGCVFVRNDQIIARARNRTNELRDATRHAELEALDEIISGNPGNAKSKHRYPMEGTKLYVTVEPCVMCASALRQVGISEVYFGCENDRFGGCGSVLNRRREAHLVHPGFQVRGGFRRSEAIMLLRRFYLTENANAPNPKLKFARVLKTAIAPPRFPDSN